MKPQTNMCTCDICGCMVRESRLHKHKLNVHSMNNELVAIKKKKKKLSKKLQMTDQRRAQQERIKAKIIEEEINNAKPYDIIWDDIIFEKDRIRFSSVRTREMLGAVEFNGVFENINDIKKEYFERLYPKDFYRLYFYQGRLIQHMSKHWSRLVEKIEIGIKYYDFKFAKTNRFGPEMTMSDAKLLLSNNFERSEYLQFLASIQDADFKLIPIIEATNTSRENSFIFRVRSGKNNILIIWENVNPNRATHVFMSTQDNHMDVLKAVESYICGHIKNKRSTLYVLKSINPELYKEIGYLRDVKHEGVLFFQDVIKSISKTH